MARQLIVELLGDNSKLTKSLDAAGKSSKSFGDKVKENSVKAGIGITAAGVAFSKLGGPIEDSKLKLETVGRQAGFTASELSQLSNTNGKLKQAMRASGNSAAEVNEALAKLVPVTKNAEEAKKALAVADEVAARKGISLESAADMVNRALAGGTKLTKEFGIEIGEGESRLDALAGTLDGSVSTALQNTVRGRMTAAVTTVKDLAGQVGQNLGPALTVLGPAITAIGPAMTFMGTATKGVSAAMSFLAANPIVLVIAAIAALGVGLVVAYQKSETFRRIVDGAVRAVGDAAMWVKDRFVDLWDFIRDLPNKIKDAAGNIAGSVVSMIPGSGVIGGIVKRLPGFADGGVVPGPAGAPQLAVVHGGETVIPNGAGRSAPTVVVNVAGSVITERDLGRVVADALRNNRLIGVT